MEIRMIIGFAVSLAAVMVLMPSFIKFLKKMSLRQSISEYSLPEDQLKAGTPIMGGVLFIIVPIIAMLIVSPASFADLDMLVVILAYAGYGLIGFVDDYLIAVKKNNDGLKPKQKFLMQVVLAVLFFILYRTHANLEVILPISGRVLHLGAGYFILVLFMFAGSSNAVNLTDGMDGLAAGVSIIACIPFLFIALRQGRPGLPVFICCLLGALLGYLYYNKKPARVFMGDTGSLALGGVLAAMAMVTKNELALILIAGVPVIETLCVMLQIAAVKTIHRRIFTYTPIHYAFRIRGMKEQAVVVMFWAAEAVFALAGFLISR